MLGGWGSSLETHLKEAVSLHLLSVLFSSSQPPLWILLQQLRGRHQGKEKQRHQSDLLSVRQLIRAPTDRHVISVRDEGTDSGGTQHSVAGRRSLLMQTYLLDY